jgi:integrase
MNQFVVDAVQMYIDSLATNRTEINLNDYLFTSLSNSNSFNYYDTLHCKSSTSTGKPIKVKRDPSAPIQVKSVEKMLKKVINDELGIDVHAGTHLMRKTFAYQVITNAPDRNRAIEMLQRILGHKSPATTLYYAGITGEEIQVVCQNLYKGRIDFCYGIGLNSKASIG